LLKLINLLADEEAMDDRAPEHAEGQPLRVLIVEDNGDGRETLRLLLELVGHDVRVAADGVDGVQQALTWHPDVAIVDLGLPRLSGYEVARRLRRDLADGVFLITQTGYCRPEDRREALAAGFDVHLSKPADPSTLIDLLEAGGRRVLDRRSRRTAGSVRSSAT
jgi:CheY-like chemotaxis protein